MTGFEAMQATPVYFWLICFLSVMAVSISKSGFGGALGSLSTPILLFVLPFLASSLKYITTTPFK